jgi:ABC-type amino acid transport substrate-binding protein
VTGAVAIAAALIVGLHPSAPPFETGAVRGATLAAPRGLEVDVAHAIAHELGVRDVEFRYVADAAGFASPGRKPWDIGLGGIARQPGPRALPYLRVPDAVLLRRGLRTPARTLADLRWLRLCVRGSGGAKRVVATAIRPVIPARTASTLPALLHLVATGACDAAVDDAAALAAARTAAPGRYGALAGRITGPVRTYVVALPSRSALAPKVAWALRRLAARHVLRALAQKWLGVDVGGLRLLPPGSRLTTVTLIGDSVSAALNWTPAARPLLTAGLNVRFEADSCRRLEAPSCGNPPPPTALQTIASDGHALGQVVVMDVGYNDAASTYAAELDTAMRAMVAAGVRHVVWVTLRERFDNYRLMNGVIRNARRRWPQLVVADWNAYSTGKPWFASDGIHLNASGAAGLAQLLRPFLAPLASR